MLLAVEIAAAAAATASTSAGPWDIESLGAALHRRHVTTGQLSWVRVFIFQADGTGRGNRDCLGRSFYCCSCSLFIVVDAFFIWPIFSIASFQKLKSKFFYFGFFFLSSSCFELFFQFPRSVLEALLYLCFSSFFSATLFHQSVVVFDLRF